MAKIINTKMQKWKSNADRENETYSERLAERTGITIEFGRSDKDKKLNAIADEVLVQNDMWKPFHSEYYGRSFLTNFERVLPRKSNEPDNLYIKRVLSSDDLPHFFSNLGEKAVQNRFNASGNTSYRAWVKFDSVENFKTNDQLKPGGVEPLEERQENGRFPGGRLFEARERVVIKEYGRRIDVTKRMLAEHGLGDIVSLLADSGSQAAKLENDLAYSVLLDNSPMADSENLFSSAHANLGTPGAVSDVTIGEAVNLMMLQENRAGQKRNVQPRHLIVGPAISVAARKALSLINGSSNSDAMNLVIDAALLGSSYFFAADPKDLAGVVVYRLNGDEKPRVASMLDYGSDNMLIRVGHDCGAAAIEYAALVKNAGA
jgi:hypothetical protein